MTKLNLKSVLPLIKAAVKEDLGTGDVTSELVFKKGAVSKAYIVPREEIVVCGMGVVQEVLQFYSRKLKLKVHIDEGRIVRMGSKIATIRGPIIPMLSAERVLLNFLQRLSGVATATSKYVRAVEGTKAKIYDTRKTVPGWRLLEKYAVRCGGGYNHRLGLYDGILIKDNHIASFGENFVPKLREIIEQARNYKDVKFVAVEVDDIEEQFRCIVEVPGVDIVLLDNMNLSQLKSAVEMRNRIKGKNKGPLLEASGNVTLANVSAVAKTGVDRIAIGAITHSAAAVDIGLDR